jgi:RNA polymerase sigma factor (sigma-70 family)
MPAPPTLRDRITPGVPKQPIEQDARRAQVSAALARLSPDHHEVIRLAHYEGMTMREIAAATGLPLATVKRQAWYALRSLRLVLEETAMPVSAPARHPARLR